MSARTAGILRPTSRAIRLRVSRRDEAYKPYHEVQAVFTGAPVRSLLELFADRWAHATGERIDLDAVTIPYADEQAAEALLASLPVTLRMPRSCLALSRTVPLAPAREHIHEIRDLYVRAIHSAQRIIYIETQYLTSHCVRDALVSRLSDLDQPKLEVVLVLPHKPEKFKEEFTIAQPQAAVIDAIVEAARIGGHALGIYNVQVPDEQGVEPIFVYIHAKLMIVDDRLLHDGLREPRQPQHDRRLRDQRDVGRAAEGDHALRAAIRRAARAPLARARRRGMPISRRPWSVTARTGLVSRLDRVASTKGSGRLRHHDLSARGPERDRQGRRRISPAITSTPRTTGPSRSRRRLPWAPSRRGRTRH